MLLFVSDVHLGRGTPTERRASERELVALLEHHADEAEHVVLLGDLFNAWMEYGAMVPRPPVRLTGALARLVDAGTPVTYVVGNRDLWHLGFFEEEVGVQLVREAVRLSLDGHGVFAAHGDGRVPSERAYNVLRPLLTSRLAHALYRWALPADAAFRLARRIAAMGSGAPETPIVDGLRDAARRALIDELAEAVVFGHGHHAELTALPDGLYLNSGYWHAERTYGTVSREGIRLMRWIEPAPQALLEVPWPRPLAAPREKSEAPDSSGVTSLFRSHSTEAGCDLGNKGNGPAVSRSTP